MTRAPNRSLFLPQLLTTAGLLVVLGMPGGSPAKAQEEAAAEAMSQREQVFAAAQKLLDDGEYKQAIAAYTQIITATGGISPLPYLKRAEAYAGVENYESALSNLNDAMTYAGGQPQVVAQAQAKRGEIYLEQGNVGDALEDLQAAASELELDANLKFQLGKAQVLAGQAAPGAEALTEYLGLDDAKFDEREVEVYRLRAQAYAGLRRFEDAETDLNQALRSDPADHETHQVKATILMLQEDYAAAAEAFADVIKYYEPKDENDDLPPVAAYLSRAAALEEVGRVSKTAAEKTAAYGEVKSQVEQLLDLLPDRPELGGIVAAARFQLGVSERLLGDLPAAIKSLTAAIDANPQAEPAFLGRVFYRRGICFYYLDEDNLALLDFEAAAGKQLDDPRANLWKGRTQAKQGKYLDAIRSYGEAIAVSDRYADAFTHRGLAYVSLREYEKGITDFDSAIRLKPTIGRPYYYRGVTYSLQGDRDRAITSLTNAIKFDPKLAVAYRALADELRQAGEGRLADEYDRKANQLEADKAQASAGPSTAR